MDKATGGNTSTARGIRQLQHGMVAGGRDAGHAGDDMPLINGLMPVAKLDVFVNLTLADPGLQLQMKLVHSITGSKLPMSPP